MMLNQNFKRIFALLLALVCVFTFAACGKKAPVVTDENAMLVLDEYSVDYDTLRYYWLTMKSSVDGGDANYFDENPEAYEQAIEDTNYILTQYLAFQKLADKYSVALSEED